MHSHFKSWRTVDLKSMPKLWLTGNPAGNLLYNPIIGQQPPPCFLAEPRKLLAKSYVLVL